ncbi:flavin reductase family protein [Rhodospirillum centenum]|uniref:Flavin reductase like domain-containing protein n=1 Tax=Rhodospirillum centenum (strain ATCC 51521 / SW) TaxID=414684 RepID=B6IUY4_RHOCS|nr:flavin reductase family protein [Rhodospirillum centenum]ACJ00066.1 conserved hypothetical protein [Rhodospirillum centenum SW]
MRIDLDTLSPRDRYRLVVSAVVPRPIALTTTVDAAGRVNAAPFSFFNVMGGDPPVLVIGTERHADGRPKDTGANIRETGEFVVNLVSEAMAGAMNVCAIPFPPGEDELRRAGLTPVPAACVRPPLIAESPASFECRLMQAVDLGGGGTLNIGRIVSLHIRDEFFDADRRHVRTEAMGLIARMHGSGWYARTGDLFRMERMTYPERTKEGEVGPSTGD